MKKYILIKTATQDRYGEYDTKVEATEAMEEVISDNNEDLDSEDEDYLTPFDFTLEQVELKEANEIVTDFEEARKLLGGLPNKDFTVSKKVLSGNSVTLADVTKLVEDVNPKHVKALIALNELFSIAQAWNKIDGFEPDFNNREQYKYYPWFAYDKDRAGFVYAYTNYAATTTNAHFGSRLCFKTANRARQFGEMFADLYNQVFL